MRQREFSYDINTSIKYRIIKNNNIEKDESKKKDNYSILKDYASSNFTKKETTPIFYQSHEIPFKPPKYEFQKRIYVSKNTHLKFNENSSIVKLEQGVKSEGSSNPIKINFVNLMAMFDEDEIKEFEIDHLLNIDLEKNKILKEKLGSIINYVNKSNCPDSQIKEGVLNILNEKMKQLNNIENNINNVAGNIENIDSIVYGNEETKVIFQNK